MKLKATKIRMAKPAAEAYKLSDGDGMFLRISPKGSKSWRPKYRINGNEKQLMLGAFPEVSLKEARERHSGARKAILLA